MCTNLAWCFGMFACKACSDCIGASFKQQVRLSYVFFDLIFVAAGLLILYGLSSLLAQTTFINDILSNFIGCVANIQNGDLSACFGISSVYRLSLALVIMHLFVLFFVIMRNDCSKVFNEKVWLFKILLVVVLYLAFFFVSNSVFQAYSTVAMVLSLFFLIFQVVMIIDLCYLWGVSWVKRYDEGSTCYMYLMIFSTIIVYGFTIYFIVSSFASFAGCGVGTFVSIVSVLFVVLGVVLVLFKLNPDGSLLTSGSVSLISSYLTWSGLTNMGEICNTWLIGDGATIVNLIAGLIMIVAALLYISVGSSEKTSGQVKAAGVNVTQAILENPNGEEDEKMKRLNEEAGHNQAVTKQKKKEISNEVYKGNSFIYFHIIMILACCYIAMLLTNFGSPVINGQSFFAFQVSSLSMWIKIATSWVTMAVYLWTVVAPTVCPQRDFS